MASPINPKGAKSDKIWREAIQRAVRRRVGDEPPKSPNEMQRLDALADALVAKGLESDVPALREIGDRLDGKPNQSVEIESEITHNYVARIPTPSKDMASWQSTYGDKLKGPTVQ